MLMLPPMRIVVDDFCECVSRCDTNGRSNVASNFLKAATQGETSSDCVQQARRSALAKPSTMWR